MTPELLLQHFNRISEAPDAIPRLRRFILDLAVRGKLVEQDPGDEPAAELLKRIEVTSSCVPDDLQFKLPSGWSAVRFGDVYSLEYGSNLPAEKRTNTGEYPVYGSNGVVGSHFECFVKSPCIVVGRKGSAGALNLSVTEGCCVTDVAYYCIPPECLDMNFSFKLFHTIGLDTLGKGVKPGLSRKEAYVLPLAIPPLAEQQRIVAKVDELMALCDQLEAERNQRETHRDKLVAASLNRISSTTAEEAKEAARFHLNLLPRLATKPEHIKQLRQTILNLAVHGKLVEQDPSDEPAAELLKRIQAEKARLVKEGKYRGSTAVKAISPDAMPFKIPSGWVCAQFGQIIVSRDGERIPVSKEERNLRPKIYDYYGASGVIDKIDSFLFDKPLLLIGEDGANLINRSTPIAFIARGKYWVNNHAHVLDGISEEFLRYIELHINAIDLKPYVTGTAQPKMNQAKMNSILIALPPLAEQQRIVAKVDELMGLCYQLEAQLTTTMIDSRRLLEAVLHDALETNMVAEG